jgi:hypothetical protein
MLKMQFVKYVSNVNNLKQRYLYMMVVACTDLYLIGTELFYCKIKIYRQRLTLLVTEAQVPFLTSSAPLCIQLLKLIMRP